MKRWISIIFVFLILASLTVPAWGAEETEPLPESYHAPTIQRMVDYVLQTGNTDEQVFHLIANAYLVDPGMVAEMLTECTQDQIAYLAKAIAYDLYRTKRTSQAIVPADGDGWLTSVATIVRQQARNPENKSLDALQAESNGEVMTQARVSQATADDYFVRVSVPTNMTPSVAAPLDISVTVGSYTTSATSRTVFFSVYKTINGTETVAASKRVTIPANELGVTSTVSLLFTEAGEYQIQAKIVNLTAEICSSATHTLNVNGKWLITVELTADRTQFGIITLYDASGAEVSHAKCLGLSVNNWPMTREFGNTPIGVYYAWLGDIQPNTVKYGPYRVIATIPYSGYVVDECNGRDGIFIHGGRAEYYAGLTEDDPNFRLKATDGCVRITNEYQLQLQNEIISLVNGNHDADGFVIIMQDGQITI